MKEPARLFTLLALLLLFAGLGFLFGRRTAQKSPESTIIRDTVTYTKIDTFCVETPVFRYSYIHDTVRTYFTTVEHDTVLVDVPIETKVYAEDSLYRAVVSGWHPSLDSLTIYPTETIVTITNTVRTPAPRWSLGVTLGPSVVATPSGSVHAGLGITAGISYRFGK